MFPLGSVAQKNIYALNAQFVTDFSDSAGNFTPTVSGTVAISSGVANFNNSATDYIHYSTSNNLLQMQKDIEFELRFRITYKGNVHVLASCLNTARSNGLYIFVNDSNTDRSTTRLLRCRDWINFHDCNGSYR